MGKFHGNLETDLVSSLPMGFEVFHGEFVPSDVGSLSELVLFEEAFHSSVEDVLFPDSGLQEILVYANSIIQVLLSVVLVDLESGVVEISVSNLVSLARLVLIDTELFGGFLSRPVSYVVLKGGFQVEISDSVVEFLVDLVDPVVSLDSKGDVFLVLSFSQFLLGELSLQVGEVSFVTILYSLQDVVVMFSGIFVVMSPSLDPESTVGLGEFSIANFELGMLQSELVLLLIIENMAVCDVFSSNFDLGNSSVVVLHVGGELSLGHSVGLEKDVPVVDFLIPEVLLPIHFANVVLGLSFGFTLD
jgi:hypothetical protein